MSRSATEIFHEAREMPPAERSAYLKGACGGDAALRAEVELLLTADAAAGDSMSALTAEANAVAAARADVPTQLAKPLSEAPGTVIGRYKLLQQIGEGGFGIVFMAEQREPVRRKVALKIIKLGMDTRQVIARFEAERQALALMDHPHIARVLDGGATDSGRPFFVMELATGKPVTDFCDEQNLSIPQRLDVFMQICHAVQHAHTKGVIHRDIKPRNVIVNVHDGRPHAKVIDFGIAKATAQHLTEMTLFTEHNQFIGTPEYMSPEQAAGSLDIDTRTDVYSLGVLLYELLTGTTPFDAKSLRSAGFAEIQRIIKEVDPPPPSTRLSQSAATLPQVAARRSVEPRRLGLLVRGDLDWIVMKALEKDRTRRYETANGLAGDVKRLLSGEPVLAAPPSIGYRVRKFVRKHRGMVLATAAVATVLVLGAITTTVGLALAERRAADLRLANEAKDEALRSAIAAREEQEWNTYATGLAFAQQALANSDWAEARRRLEFCPERKRGWEWRFLKGKADAVVVMIGEESGTENASNYVSPDETKLLGVGLDGRARLWDAAGNVISVAPNDPRNRYPAFSPDGKLIITYTNRGLQLWDLEWHKVGGVIPHDTLEYWAKFSPNGRYVVAQTSKETQIWDVAGNRVGPPLRPPETVSGYQIQFSADSRLVIARAGNDTAVFDLEGGAEPILAGSWSAAAFGADGQRICTTGERETQVWDLRGLALGPPVPGTFVELSPDQRLLLTANGGAARLWTQNGELVCARLPRGRFSPDGRRFLGVSERGTELWSVECRREWVHARTGGDALFSPSGEQILESGGGLAQLCDLHGNALSEPVRCDVADPEVVPFVFDPSGSLALVRNGETVHLLESSGRARGERRMTSQSRSAKFGFSRRGQFVWYTSGDSMPAFIARTSEFDSCDRSLGFTPDASVAIDVLGEEPLPGASGEKSAERAPPEKIGVVTTFAWSPDRTRLVTSAGDRIIRVWEPTEPHELALLPAPAEVVTLKFTFDGTRLIVLLSNGEVRMWDARPATERQKDRDARWAERDAGAALAQKLIEGPVATAELETALVKVRSTPALRRLTALSFLRMRIAEITAEAGYLHRTLVREQGTKRNVAAATTGMGLGPRLEAELAARNAKWTPDSNELNSFAWSIVIDPKSSPDDVRKAVDAAREAAALTPEYAAVVNTLGIALYRHGDYAEALATLERSRQIYERDGQVQPADGAFIAMCQFKLGRLEEAHEELKRLRNLMATFTGNESRVEAQRFLEEAEELINGSGASSGASDRGGAELRQLRTLLPLTRGSQ